MSLSGEICPTGGLSSQGSRTEAYLESGGTATEPVLAACPVASVGGRHLTVTLSNPEEAPRADPHAGCCGSRGRKTPGDPIRRHSTRPARAALHQVP